jgi:sugar/nucleoside kinase (ribokinase family)
MKVDLAVAGHIVLDYIGREGLIQGPRLGGPCTYAGLAANSLGAKAVAISRVGEDFGSKRLSFLEAHGISTSHIKTTSSRTTCFRISYRDGERAMRVASVCDPISDECLSKLPSSFAMHIGPVLDEISPALAIRLASRNHLVGLDPQGYLRQLDSNGAVRGRRWRNPSLLRRVAVLKVSEAELPSIIGQKWSSRKLSALGPDIILLTRGSRGTIVWSRENGTFNVPAYETPVRDPTGAGDALAGAFLISWVRTGDLPWSAATGVAVASFVVAKIRIGNFGTRRQIESRAMEILEGTTRI